MTRNIASGCHELLNDQPFPAFPFSNPRWLGFIFNRDLYGVAGIPRDVFESVLASLKVSGEARLIFVPAVTPLDGGPGFPVMELVDWQEYLAFLKGIDFCPEYYLVTADGSVLFWFDPDAVVVGGVPEVMRGAADHLGSVDKVMRRSADDFGVSVSDAASDVAAYIRNLGSSGQNL
ncbi:MAG: hypothetical protein ACREPV_01940 [Lysobacter sp.]